MSLFVWYDDTWLREFRIELSPKMTVFVTLVIFGLGVFTGAYLF